MKKKSAEDYLDKLLNSVNDEKEKKEKFKETAKMLEDAMSIWEQEGAYLDFEEEINAQDIVKEEKKSEKENFLDALLSGAQNTEFGMNQRKPDTNPMYSRRVSRSEADFLREFEAELEGTEDDLTDLFAEFEKVVEPEDKLEEEDIQVAEEAVAEEETIAEDSFALGDVDLASLVNEAAGVMGMEAAEEDSAVVELNPEDIPLDVVSMDEISSDIFMDLFEGEDTDNLYAAGDIPVELGSEETQASPEEGIDLSNLGDEDLMNLLAGADELSDIGSLLSKSEATEIPMEELDAFAAFAEGEMFAQQISAEPVEEELGIETKSAKKGGKGNLLAKIKGILGNLLKDDEEEVSLKSAKGPSAETLAGENEEILAELDSAEAGEKKSKKKEKKEKKPKKEKAPKKPKAPKAPKPKKEKKPKEVDNTPPLPKGPVLMIWIMVASMIALVMLGANLIKYNTPISEAKSLQNQGHYAEAFAKLNGLEIKEKDMELYNQLAVLSTVDSELNQYEVFTKAKKPDMAFDSLICAAGRCYINEADADVYGCLGVLETMKITVSNELKQNYQMTYEEAIEMYTIRDRDDYTIALYKKLTELGIEWE